MGDRVRCVVHFGDAQSEGNAHLEADTLLFRGDFRLAIRFAEMTSVSAEEGRLRVCFAAPPPGEATFDLGSKAQRWAKAIREPKTVLDKLGVKAGMQVWLCGLTGAAFSEFPAQLSDRGASLRAGPLPATAGDIPIGQDMIFWLADHRDDLDALALLRAGLAPAGALWVLRPKATPAITEMDVLQGGRAAGLVDTKVVAFSGTHSAAKFVIPVAQRPASGSPPTPATASPAAAGQG